MDRNLPSEPSSLSHKEQRCLFVAVNWMTTMTIPIIKALGSMEKSTIANIMETSYGFITIYVFVL